MMLQESWDLTAEFVEVHVWVQSIHFFPGDAPLADDVHDVLARAHRVGSV